MIFFKNFDQQGNKIVQRSIRHMYKIFLKAKGTCSLATAVCVSFKYKLLSKTNEMTHSNDHSKKIQFWPHKSNIYYSSKIVHLLHNNNRALLRYSKMLRPKSIGAHAMRSAGTILTSCPNRHMHQLRHCTEILNTYMKFWHFMQTVLSFYRKYHITPACKSQYLI